MNNFDQQLRALPNYISEYERTSPGVPKIWLIDDDQIVIAKNKQVAILTYLLQTFDTLDELKDYIYQRNNNQNDQTNTTADIFSLLAETPIGPLEFSLAHTINIEFYIRRYVDNTDLDRVRNEEEFNGSEFLKYVYEGPYVLIYFVKRKLITEMTILTPTFRLLNKLFV